MPIEQRTYRSIAYVVNTEPVPTGGSPTRRKYAGVGRVSLIVDPSNLADLAARAEGLFKAIAYDSLTISSANGELFADVERFAPFAPYVRRLDLRGLDKRSDFSVFERLKNVEVLTTLVEKPKNLKLRAFPKLISCTVGVVRSADTLVGASSLEELRLFRRYNWKEQGWQWLATLPNLRELTLAQQEITSFADFPPCPQLDWLTVSFPRGLKSLSGIGAFENLTKLQLESARQVDDLEPIAALRKLKHLSLDVGRLPKSVDVLRRLACLETAFLNGHTVK
jgi:Leucine-rich repeat (LRR) protein